MTVKALKSMFQPGQRWHALRTGPGRHRDEIRTVHKIQGKQIVFRVPSGELYWTPFPKASEVLESRPGFVRFVYSDVPGVEVSLTLQA